MPSAERRPIEVCCGDEFSPAYESAAEKTRSRQYAVFRNNQVNWLAIFLYGFPAYRGGRSS